MSTDALAGSLIAAASDAAITPKPAACAQHETPMSENATSREKISPRHLRLAPFQPGLLRAVVLAAVAAIAPSTGAPAKELPLTAAQVKQLDIKLAEVRVAVKTIVTTLPATIVAPMNTRFAVPAPFSGTVLSVNVLPGQEVRQGEPLVTLASRDLTEAVVKLRQAEADLQGADVIAQRQRGLFDKNLIAANKVAEAEAQVEKIRALVRESQRLLTIGNIKLNSDGSYSLTAPKAARVVEMRATPGAALQAMDTAVIVDTSRELWLEAQLPAQLIGKIGVGDKIELPNGAMGKVISVGISLDPLTRSTSLLAEIPAGAGHISGQTTTVTVVKPAVRTGFEVPTDALSWINGTPHVFLRTEAGFLPLPVTVLGRTAEVATIEGDLRAGQMVAINGLASLEKMIGGGD